MTYKVDQAAAGFEKFLMRGNQAVGEGAIRAGISSVIQSPPKTSSLSTWRNGYRKSAELSSKVRANLPVLIWSLGRLPEEADV